MDKIEIKDLYLSAYLKSEGIPLISFKSRNGHTVFIFQNDEKIGELINDYIKDQASINIKIFRNSLRDLKSLASGDIPIPKSEEEK
jgi:hypothetical protein